MTFLRHGVDTVGLCHTHCLILVYKDKLTKTYRPIEIMVDIIWITLFGFGVSDIFTKTYSSQLTF